MPSGNFENRGNPLLLCCSERTNTVTAPGMKETPFLTGKRCGSPDIQSMLLRPIIIAASQCREQTNGVPFKCCSLVGWQLASMIKCQSPPICSRMVKCPERLQCNSIQPGAANARRG